MGTEIHPAVRERVTETVRAVVDRGLVVGLVVFDRDGGGGDWYPSDDEIEVDVPADAIVVRLEPAELGGAYIDLGTDRITLTPTAS